LGDVTPDPALCVQLNGAVSTYRDIIARAANALDNAEAVKAEADQRLLEIRKQAGVEGWKRSPAQAACVRNVLAARVNSATHSRCPDRAATSTGKKPLKFSIRGSAPASSNSATRSTFGTA